ncbi:unnamed protein product [Dovyalis caffra]|uniref:Uncharacterized protein n=1 Tax=Dovyalis caffra TaxID=77055 RepID=A0AAV1SWP9_9ROSI|nr:unnamed protein product [Dovyalis caffra]
MRRKPKLQLRRAASKALPKMSNDDDSSKNESHESKELDDTPATKAIAKATGQKKSSSEAESSSDSSKDE